jgi:hypothetical protein
MIAHDFAKSVCDCPACQRLLQIEHDLAKSPSECPGCIEAAAIRGGYTAHATSSAKDASAHHVSASQHLAPITPGTSAAAPHDLISARAKDAAREAVRRMRDERAEKQKIAASWDIAIADINHRNQSPGGR